METKYKQPVVKRFAIIKMHNLSEQGGECSFSLFYAVFSLHCVCYMDESTLLYEISQGNELAFKTLFNRHRNKLYNYLFGITKSTEIAEEIVIDVFLKLWQGRDLLVEIKNVEAFLHKVACNKALDFLRLAARHKRLQEFVKQEIMTRAARPDEALQENECRDLLNKAMEQLSPQRRLIFSLSRDHGLSHEEIASQLHLSRHTVRNTIAEGLRLIRRFFKEHHTLILFFSRL